MLIRIPRGWRIPERDVTPESANRSRRDLLIAAGLLSAEGLPAAGASRNPEFAPDKVERPITEEWAVTSYNNFYEFDPNNKEAVKDKTGKFTTSPWKIDVSGLVMKPQTFDLDDLARRMPLEERIYRFRCVEAWSMTVPWTGFPLSELIKVVEPKAEAKFVRLVTASRPKEMPGMVAASWYPWPYFEALRMDEAMNPLTLLVTGLYGKPLPKQNGAPVRIVAPWKYGYKSIKSIVRIEFVSRQPATLWNQLQPLEYGFYSNVNPRRPHPRWSQASEKVIPNMERVPTKMYNGYEKYVGHLYTGREV